MRALLRAGGLLVILGLVAHNGGAGWVQTLADLVAGAVVVGLVAPALLLRRATLTLVTTPSDATAGTPIEIEVRASTRLRVLAVQPAGLESFVGPVGRPRRDDNTIVVLPRRGSYDTLVLDIATAAPFAMLWWTRRIVVPLASELCVAPRLGPLVVADLPSAGAGATTRASSSEGGEIQGGIRPYRAGDRRNRVHWPASAHAAELMVREISGSEAELVIVEVVLPTDPDDADHLAERALGTVVALIDQGSPVRLVTTETSGERSGLVADRRAAGRRLARAVALAEREPGVALRLARPATRTAR